MTLAMTDRFPYRPAIICVIALLLIALFALQARATRDLENEQKRQTLDSLQIDASLLAHDVDTEVSEAYLSLQIQSGVQPESQQPAGRIKDVPRVIQSLTLVDHAGSESLYYKGRPDGSWEQVEGNTLANTPGESKCSSRLLVGDLMSVPVPLSRNRADELPSFPKCIYARLDEKYLSGNLISDLISRYFPTLQRRIRFRLIDRSRGNVLKSSSGPWKAADFSHNLLALHPSYVFGENSPKVVFVQSTPESSEDKEGLWTLQIADGSGLGVSAFHNARYRNLMFSIFIELFLFLSAVLLVVSSRRLDSAARQRMQFAAGITHELRTPLSAIAMLSRNQADGLVSDHGQVQRYGSLINEQAARLTTMVEHTLQFAGFQARPQSVALGDIDVTFIIKAAVAAQHLEISRTGADVQLILEPQPLLAMGNAQLLQQIIENLLSNALKYSNCDPTIRITAALDPDSSAVLVTFADQGVGISASEQRHVFEPFFRGQYAMAQQIPGSGIGLSLVQAATKAQQGTITLSSQRGRGCEFTIRLQRGGVE